MKRLLACWPISIIWLTVTTLIGLVWQTGWVPW